MEIEIRSKQGIWKISKMLSERTAHGIFPHVYLPEWLYADFTSDQPTTKVLSIVEHEKTHVERQAEFGWFYWLILYFISSRFRLNEELIATKAEMQVLKNAGEIMNTENKARMLSSWLYWKCVKYEQAKLILDEMWDEL